MDVLAIALTLLFFGAIIGFAVLRMWRSARRWESFATLWNSLSQVVPMVPMGPYMGHGHGEVGGRQCVTELTKGSRHTPAYLRVRLALSHFASQEPLRDEAGHEVRGPAGARFRRRTAWDRAAARLKLERPVATGDAAFDAAVIVESTASDRVLRALLAGEPVRRAVRELLDSGARTVDVLVASPFASVSWRNPSLEQAGRVVDAARALSTLADAVPVVAGDVIQRGRGLGRAWVPIGWAAAGMAGFLVWMELAGAHPIVLEGSFSLSGIGIVLCFPAVLLSYVALRGRAGALSMLAYSFPASIFGVVFGTLALGQLANQVLDKDAPTPHDVRIMSVHAYTSRFSRSHQEFREVRVRNWDIGGREVLINTPGQDTRYKVGGRARVFTRPGALGWEWVSSIEPIEADPAAPEAPAPALPTYSPAGSAPE